MKVIITMENPHDSRRPTRLANNDGRTLDDVAQLVFFFMEHCRIISVEVF